MKILEVNNIDLQGRRFNGYDLIEYINEETHHSGKQLVNQKESNNDNVYPIYNSTIGSIIENKLSTAENQLLSVHSILSISDCSFRNSNLYKEADIIHFHMYHNAKFSLYSLIKICNEKKVVLTLHDPWFLTGRCVHPYGCHKWQSGCIKCSDLTTLFPMKEDNCNYLWKLKKKIFDSINIDIVVASKFMLDMVKDSPIMQSQSNIHLIPFGVDTKYFFDNGTRNNLKRRYNIPISNIVLFFRAQKEFKGTEYIVEALRKLKCSEDITLVTCGEMGMLDPLKNNYQVIELGTINNEEMLDAYRLCDIFLMPSKGETFGLMAVEAMACSRPVIIFNNSALPSVTFAPSCGFLVEDRNVDKLKDAIVTLSEDEADRKRRGLLGRKIVEKNYNIRDYNKNILGVYEKAFSESRLKKNFSFDMKEKKNDKEVEYLNYLLYIVTNKVFNRIPRAFSGYKQFRYKNSKVEIDYSNFYIKSIIENYNEKLCNYYTSMIRGTIYRPSPNKLINKIKTAFFLLNYDRKELLKTLYMKTAGKIIK